MEPNRRPTEPSPAKHHVGRGGGGLSVGVSVSLPVALSHRTSVLCSPGTLLPPDPATPRPLVPLACVAGASPQVGIAGPQAGVQCRRRRQARRRPRLRHRERRSGAGGGVGTWTARGFPARRPRVGSGSGPLGPSSGTLGGSVDGCCAWRRGTAAAAAAAAAAERPRRPLSRGQGVYFRGWAGRAG